jgi:predicted GNAT superfamily acetyltransferase
MDPSETIVIRDIERLSEMHQVEQLQKKIWGVSDLDVLPALTLLPLKEVGSILIGAFDGDQMVGFVLGFPGLSDGRIIIHSDMLGVLPEYRSFSLGLLLKLAQRERALSMGIEIITWTFDPLRAVNANLNFSRLGVTASRYEVDYYGETSSFLHRYGTDRLWVTWALSSPRTRDRIEGPKPTQLDERFSQDSRVLVQCADGSLPLIGQEPSGDAVLIEIPANLGELSKDQPELASEWRAATRQAFTTALDSAYLVEDFRFDAQAQKGIYLLTRQKSDE